MFEVDTKHEWGHWDALLNGPYPHALFIFSSTQWGKRTNLPNNVSTDISSLKVRDSAAVPTGGYLVTGIMVLSGQPPSFSQSYTIHFSSFL
jgi:hypothetical protein